MARKKKNKLTSGQLEDLEGQLCLLGKYKKWGKLGKDKFWEQLFLVTEAVEDRINSRDRGDMRNDMRYEDKSRRCRKSTNKDNFFFDRTNSREREVI